MTHTCHSKEYRRSSKVHNFEFAENPRRQHPNEYDEKEAVSKVVMIFIGIPRGKAKEKIDIRQFGKKEGDQHEPPGTSFLPVEKRIDDGATQGVTDGRRHRAPIEFGFDEPVIKAFRSEMQEKNNTVVLNC